MKNVVDYMLCIVYNGWRTTGKVPVTINPSKTMKICITRSWYVSSDGTPLRTPVITVLSVFDRYSSAFGKMFDIQSRYIALGYKVLPFLGGLSFYCHGNLTATFKLCDYED